MARIKEGRLIGTGSALYIGLEGIPDRFTIKNMKSASNEEIIWRKNSGAAETSEGVFRSFDGTQVVEDELGFGEGVAPYRGGDVMEANSSVYFILDPKAEKNDANTTTSPISRWTLDTAANRTGHFDYAVDTNSVGVGSNVVIESAGGKIYGGQGEVWITAISNDGDGTDDITLNEVVPSGEVLSVGGKTTYVGAPAGSIIPAGIKLNETGNLNVSGEVMHFIAEWFD